MNGSDGGKTFFSIVSIYRSMPIAASRIFCDGAFGSGFVCSQYSESEIYKPTTRPNTAASVVEFWKMMHTVTHRPK